MPGEFTSNIALVVYAAFINVLATVFLVTRLLECQEERRWRKSVEFVCRRLARSTNTLCFSVTEGIGMEIVEFRFHLIRSAWPGVWEASRIISDRLREWRCTRGFEMLLRVADWDHHTWQSYGREVDAAGDELRGVMATLGGRLDNLLSESILKLDQSLEGFSAAYKALPQVWDPSAKPTPSPGELRGQQNALAWEVLKLTTVVIDFKDILHSRPD